MGLREKEGLRYYRRLAYNHARDLSPEMPFARGRSVHRSRRPHLLLE